MITNIMTDWLWDVQPHVVSEKKLLIILLLSSSLHMGAASFPGKKGKVIPVTGRRGP
jgi:hypothetical protein